MNPVLPHPQAIPDAAVLDLCSGARLLSSAQKARSLLSASVPGTSPTELDAAPLGAWNIALLRLRALHFGPTVVMVDHCRSCQQTVEFKLQVDHLLSGLAAPSGESTGEILADDWRILYRPLTAGDVLACPPTADANATAQGKRVLGRTIISVEHISVEHSREPREVDQLPTALWDELAQAHAKQDPASEIVFELVCPQCGTRWDSLLEVGEYLWTEFSHHADTLLRQVHVLASMYGWTEREIFALPPQRRSAYLALIEESTPRASANQQRLHPFSPSPA